MPMNTFLNYYAKMVSPLVEYSLMPHNRLKNTKKGNETKNWRCVRNWIFKRLWKETLSLMWLHKKINLFLLLVSNDQFSLLIYYYLQLNIIQPKCHLKPCLFQPQLPLQPKKSNRRKKSRKRRILKMRRNKSWRNNSRRNKILKTLKNKKVPKRSKRNK